MFHGLLLHLTLFHLLTFALITLMITIHDSQLLAANLLPTSKKCAFSK